MEKKIAAARLYRKVKIECRIFKKNQKSFVKKIFLEKGMPTHKERDHCPWIERDRPFAEDQECIASIRSFAPECNRALILGPFFRKKLIFYRENQQKVLKRHIFIITKSAEQHNNFSMTKN